jgi:hypothetical protein
MAESKPLVYPLQYAIAEYKGIQLKAVKISRLGKTMVLDYKVLEAIYSGTI